MASRTEHPAAPTGELVALRPTAPPPPPAGRRLSDVDEWGRSERARRRLRRLYDPVYRHWFRAEWEGLEHIPRSGGALLVANHAGALPVDAPLLMHGVEAEVGRPVYGLADFLFRSLPFVGTAWSRAGGVSAHPDNAYRLLRDQGQLVLVFPEGTKGTGKRWADRYHLARFGRGGFVEIAMRAGVPVIPVAIVGSEEAMPTVATFPLLARTLGIPYVPLTANMLLLGPLGLVVHFPAKIRFRVLPPVRFDLPADQARYPRSRILDEAEAIRSDLQDAVVDMLRHRRSVWRG